MTPTELTSPTAVRKAIEEFDRLGKELFLRKYGFGSARSYFLIHEGRQYDSKAIIGVAYGYQYPDKEPVQAEDFVGGKLPTDAGGRLVQLGFDVPGADQRPDGWSLAECEITVGAYFDCMKNKILGEGFDQTQVLQAVASAIGRSRNEVDNKFQNIDSILSEAELPPLNNPVAPNSQKLLRYVVLDPLAAHMKIFELTNPSAAEPVQDDSVIFVPIPVVDPSRFDRPDDVTSLRAMKTDFARKDAANRALGQSAEEWVVNLEREQLSKAGREDLAEKVRWVSREDGDGLGHDIASFEPDGTAIYIEVKATNQGAASPFYVSETELRVSNARGDLYRLYRVFEFSKSPKVFIVKGPLSQTLNLRAVQHIAVPACADQTKSTSGG